MVLDDLTQDSADQSHVLGGFSQSVELLEFNQIRQQVASYARTLMGQDAARNLAPDRDLLEIATRQQETTESRQFLEQGGSLEFGPQEDFQEYVQRALLGGLLRGGELYPIHDLVRAAGYDRANLSRHEELPLLSSYAENIPDHSSLQRAIGAAISPAGEVLDDASPTLRDLRHESRRIQQNLNEVMERSLRRFQRQELVQEPIITQRNGRLVLLIKAEMRPRVAGIVHDVSDSGATVFIEPMAAVEQGNRWREARLAEDREVERVLRQLSGMVGQAGEDLLLTLDLLGRLDLSMAKGRYSISLKATQPWVTGQEGQDRNLRLTGARHPLLTGDVVPVSLDLGAEFTVMLITGPNAGGKTVTLKTVGLLALMAHAGLHVPAEQAHFPLLDGVYADIGDQQSIEQALSTFSSHVQNLLSIMGQATGNSLVLVDELGTSTDPEEGSALATAILSHFQSLGPWVVATTHHRGVARYVQETPGMINASVDLDPQTLGPTYRLTLGLPGRSYALTIAARLGLPPEVIEQARTSMSPVERDTESLLGELQEERRVVEQLRQDAEAAMAQSRQNLAETESSLAAVEATKAEMLEESRQELQERIADLLQRLQRAERALDQPEARSTLQEQRSQLQEAAREVRSVHWQPIEVKRTPWQEKLGSGDRVFIRGIPRPVEVISSPDDEGQVEVLLGTMRAKIPSYQLERPAAGHEPAARQGVYFNRPSIRQLNTEVDLRGLRVDEALSKVDDLLNNAALGGVEAVRIIHGKGTGVLRRSIREYLTRHSLAGSIAPGDGSGGDGVTVVELK
ncbi:MAG TPA: endonuclease MutS2 [Dehalococcoidia bacterium]|nr:endonuclease MutS2 [Dehalococcoidia bacterium]